MDSYRILWSPDLSVGDPEIDAQHRKLIESVGSIPDDSSSPDENLLAEAVTYAAAHFEFEEKLLERIDYPERAAHKRLHRKLMTILMAYRRDYLSGKTDLYAFKHFMFRWIRDHIMDADREYGRHLASRKAAGGASGGSSGC